MNIQAGMFNKSQPERRKQAAGQGNWKKQEAEKYYTKKIASGEFSTDNFHHTADLSMVSVSTNGSTGGTSDGGKELAISKKAPTAAHHSGDASVHLLYLSMSLNAANAAGRTVKERAMTMNEMSAWVEKKIAEQESIIDSTDRKIKEAKILLEARSGNKTTWTVTASQLLNMEAKFLHAVHAIEQLDELVLEIATGGSEVQYFKDKAEDILNAPVTRYSFQDKELILKECELKGYGWKDPSGKMLSV
jgi:hypothetical protein